MSKRQSAHLLRFSGTLDNPLFCFFPGFVESKEAGLAAAFDQLIGLRDELGGMDPGRELGVRGDRASFRIP